MDNGLSHRAVVVDDHPLLREGLCRLLTERQIEVCGVASAVGEALELINELAPDLAIVDICLVGGSGLTLVEELMERNSKTEILVYSVHDENLYAPRALNAGARGYVNKCAGVDELLAAIDCVVKGKVYLSPTMSTKMLLQAVGARPRNSAEAGYWEILTPRELEIFNCMGQGLTTKQIALHLRVSPKTVETHRDHLRQKLKVKTGLELLRLAIGSVTH